MRRVEDDRFLDGSGSFVADLRLPDQLEAVVARSHDAHGILRSINAGEVAEGSGVQAVFTAADLPNTARFLDKPFYELTNAFIDRYDVMLRPSVEPVLAHDRVQRVGEPLAFIVARDRYCAEDAREKVISEVESLPVLTDPFDALEPDAFQVHADVPGNLHGSFRVIVGEPERVASEAAHRVSDRFRISRSAGSPIENKGVVAQLDDGLLTVWSTTQIPHRLRAQLSSMLRLKQDSIRVIAPDMGGSFGGGIYPEEVLVPWAAMRLGKPVRWLEERSEELVNSRHSRDQIVDAELSFDGDGFFVALRVNLIQDCGVFNPFGITLPFNVVTHIRSQYQIPHFESVGLCVVTNKTRNTPVRGAGRPEATFVIERLVDMAARKLGLDPVDIRRRNLIPPERMPYDMAMLYRDGNPLIYDTGDFPDQLETALEASDYASFRQRQRNVEDGNRALGIGIACHVEGTGLGPQESAEVGIGLNGEVVVKSGSQPHGQSHATTLSQVCAEVLNLDPSQITFLAGDTSLVANGGGTYGSRSAVTAGSAVHAASADLRRRILDLAAEIMEIAADDLVLENGRVWPKGVPDLGLTFSELARFDNEVSGDKRGSQDGGLIARHTFQPSSVTFGSGTQVAVVEVDLSTGRVEVKEIVVVEDCGTILNPTVVDGQQQGGVAHGIGNILLEVIQYDDAAQPINTTFMDYLLPTSVGVPPIKVIHRPHPTSLNPLGVKGTGEGATASTPAAVANAVADALRHLGIRISEMPISPERLLALIEASLNEAAE